MRAGPNPHLGVATLLATLSLVAAHVYNATLDPWNINKNQGAPCSSDVL
jgi:hypothetical protein